MEIYTHAPPCAECAALVSSLTAERDRLRDQYGALLEALVDISSTVREAIARAQERHK